MNLVDISAAFDGGNCSLLGAEGIVMSLEMHKDNAADFRQWFAFRAAFARPARQIIRIANAGQCNRAEAWQGFQAAASYDGMTWFRLPTTFDGTSIEMEFVPDSPLMTIAGFALYPLARHDSHLRKCLSTGRAKLEVLGHSIQGRPIDCLKIGTGKRICWITARQHPSETMAAWSVEGVLDRLLAPGATAAAMAESATFYVVPNVNPDGSFIGNTRTNYAGRDLNRVWDAPDESCPEVLCIRQKMNQTGVDFYLDIHGEETLPYAFIVSSDQVPSMTKSIVGSREAYERRLREVNSAFQSEEGYQDKPGEADLAIASNYIAERFGCYVAHARATL